MVLMLLLTKLALYLRLLLILMYVIIMLKPLLLCFEILALGPVPTTERLRVQVNWDYDAGKAFKA